MQHVGITSSFHVKSKTDKLFIVSVEAGLRHHILLAPTHQVFHYDRSITAEIVELTT